MDKLNRILFVILILFITSSAMTIAGEGKLLDGIKTVRPNETGDDHIIHRCLIPKAEDRISFGLTREKPWSLPDKALADDRTVNILVLRYNFIYETEDNPNTTGRGHMNLSADSAAFYNENEHYIDPPPHDSNYFDAHLKALSEYYLTVSQGKLHLTWDVYPSGKDSIYQLPNDMSFYGACADELDFDSIIAGLERYFVDCIRLADSTTPEIEFGNYESIMLFHAGTDQQNNIGFPPTCNDMFTGFIRFGSQIEAEDGTVFENGVPVDGGVDTIRTALLVPEAISQDNRATAMNAVLAHEFGHQLGLVDLYRTGSFRTQLGDFALMDNNGFGTGIDFGFPVGSVFGINPLFPCAWSRAYLGFEEVVDFRQGSDIRLVAAEIVSDGIKIARVPISDDEYYLIENRVMDTDNLPTFILADPATSVILGPSNANRELTGEYDHLMPGSGVLIYHVDESVARMDFNGNGINNFYENQLQLDADKRFIRIVEADGLVGFGGFYNAGFGGEDDMYREDRNNSLTPNTNPPSIDNTGNNTHIRITEIRRDSAMIDFAFQPLDTVVKFNVETDGMVNNFPIRCGYRFFAGVLNDNNGQPVVSYFNPLSVIADDLDRDGSPEIITASNEMVLAFSTAGETFINTITTCDPCPTYTDASFSRFDSEHFITGDDHYRSSENEVPLYFQTPGFITTGPVTGDFGELDSTKLVAVGILLDIDSGAVIVNALQDNNDDAQADNFISFVTFGWPQEISFGEILYVVTNSGLLYVKKGFDDSEPVSYDLQTDSILGTCRIGEDLIILAGTVGNSNLYYYDSDTDVLTDEFALNDVFDLGPILVDVDRDEIFEVVAASKEGKLIYVEVDESMTDPDQIFSIKQTDETGFDFTIRPMATDVDFDSYPDIVVGGIGNLYAFDLRMNLISNYPIQIDDRYPEDPVIASPVAADLQSRGVAQIIFPTEIGNVYSFGNKATFGFPLSGGERSNSPAVIVDASDGAKLGYIGDDGWFYLWDFWAGELNTMTGAWLMNGADASGSFAIDMTKLTTPGLSTNLLPEESYYCYPNPVTIGATTIRYTLNQIADDVSLSIYNLAGEEISQFDGSTFVGVNEQIWECNNISPGVYRCVIEADFNGQIEKAFTDIAVIR